MLRIRPWLWLVLSLACSTGAGNGTTNVPASQSAPGLLKAIPAEVRPLASAPRKTAPHGQASVTLLAEGHNAFMGKLELAPNASVPEHQDPTEEYIHVLSGRATMTMDGKHYEVEPGTTVYMPAYAKVSVQNGSEPLVAIQVFAGPAPARRYDDWK